LPLDAVGQEIVHPSAVMSRTTARGRTLAYIFDPRRHALTGQFLAGGLKNEGSYLLLVPQIFQIFVSGVLSTGLVAVDRFGENLGTLALDSMAPWTQGKGHQDREDKEERLRSPERQEDFEEETLHDFIEPLQASSN